MVMKSYVLEFTIPANSPWARYAALFTPAGLSRVVREIRIWFSLIPGPRIRFYWETEYLFEIVGEVWNNYMLPYSADWSVPAGTGLFVEGANSANSPCTVKIELIVEEARA